MQESGLVRRFLGIGILIVAHLHVLQSTTVVLSRMGVSTVDRKKKVIGKLTLQMEYCTLSWTILCNIVLHSQTQGWWYVLTVSSS
jgi:hypothetical protein